jgi:hypothetical protein
MRAKDSEGQGMKKTTIAITAALAVLGGAAFGEEECALAVSTPTMPDPAQATAEDRSTTINAIKDFQAALGEYRICLNETIDDKRRGKAARQAALDAYNASVDQENELVAAWQEFDAAYEKASS